MKKVLLLLFTFVSFNKIFCQINIKDNKDFEITLIGEIKPLGAFLADCKRYVSVSHDTVYVIMFKNVKYNSISDYKSFSFNETGGDFNKLFKIIEENFKNKEKKSVEIPLKDGNLTLSFVKQMGAMFLTFFWTEKGISSYTGELTFNQVKKLFGNPDSL